MNLETTYLGLSLPHPIIASASPLSATLDGIRRLEDAGAAAIVAASVYEEEVRGEELALTEFAAAGAESHPEVTNYLPPLAPSRGMLEAHLEMIRRAAESVDVPLIASLNGTTREGWIEIATGLAATGVAAIELNLFHRATDPAETSAQAERQLVDTVRHVCGTVQIPVAVKLFPHFTAPAHLATSLADAGASGIVLFNRNSEPDINLDLMRFETKPTLSSADEIGFPLMWIALLARRTKLSLAGGRAIEGVQEVVKYLLAGADAVQTASALLRHGPAYMRQLVEGLADWLEAREANAVTDIIGLLSAGRGADPGRWFRAQYPR